MNKRNAPLTTGQRKTHYKNLPYYLLPLSKCQGGIPIFAGNGRVVGEVKGGVFLKKLKASKHFLQKPPAICFDVVSLEQAEKAGAIYVRIIDIETGKTYHAPLRLVWQKGFALDRGHGRQIGLALNYWQLKEKKERQLSLFGGE